jgi:hypothetical protein
MPMAAPAPFPVGLTVIPSDGPHVSRNKLGSERLADELIQVDWLPLRHDPRHDIVNQSFSSEEREHGHSHEGRREGPAAQAQAMVLAVTVIEERTCLSVKRNPMSTTATRRCSRMRDIEKTRHFRLSQSE